MTSDDAGTGTDPLTDPLTDLLAAAAMRVGTAERPASVERIPLQSSWYRLERIEARFPSGLELRCVLKDYGSYTEAKSRMADRRERERFFYRHVAAQTELGLARYVGEVWEPSEPRYWLVLEHVEGVPLSWCELPLWFEAAEWLGRFRAATRPWLSQLIASGRFTDHGPVYFSKIAARAAETGETYSADVVRAVEECVEAYRSQTELLMSGPRGLVHGAFRPDQVLVDAAPGRARICPLDWEIAGIGSPLYDLATLADGFDDEELETLLDHYSAGAQLGNEACTIDELRSTVAACRLHRTMKWIAGARKRGLPPETVTELATTLVGTAEEVTQ